MAESHAADSSAEAPPKRGPGLLTLVKGLAFVSVIVLLEIAAAMALFPSSEETRSLGERLAAATQGVKETATEADSSTAHEQVEERLTAPTVEASLGTYHVISFNPATGASMGIDFALFGVVLASDEAELTERYSLHAKRINEQVTVAIRGMESADFTDPGLGLIKRVILEKVNRALGKPLLREAVFNDFAFVER